MSNQINFVLQASIEKYMRNMEAAEQRMQGFVLAGERLKNVGSQMSLYLTAPLTLVGGLALKAAGDIQALEKGFAATYKGAGDLNEELAKTREVAKLPGLGLKEAIQGATNLQAVGFAAEQSRDILKGFGNALATVGKGKADLDGVITALSQMAAKGKISAEEINQIAERVPQIRAVMKDAFGTADTEELQKMGISVDEFVSRATTELNKLPKVSGGINNAFENMQDVGTLALASLGNAINKAFDIEGLAAKLSDALAGIVDKFNALSPAMQKTILVVGGLAAAAGPLLFAIGAISSALPLLSVGFAALTGPIGLIIAGVAAAAFLIIKNWDAIKAYFTTGGGAEIFTKVKDIAIKAFETIKAYLMIFVNTAKAIWDTFGGAIMATGQVLFKNLESIFSAGLDLLGGILDVFRALFTGDWENLWIAVKNLAKIAINGIITLMGNLVTTLPRLLNAALKGMGVDNGFTRALDKGLENTKKLINSLKFELEDLYKVEQEKDIKAPAKSTDSAAGNTQTPFSIPSEAAQKQKEILSDLQKNFNDATKMFAVFGNSYDVLGEKSKMLEGAIGALIANGLSPQSAIIKSLKGELDTLNTLDMSPLQNTFQQFSESAGNALKSVKGEIKAFAVESSAAMTEFMAKMQADAQFAVDIASALGSSLRTAIADTFVGMGEILGEAFAGMHSGVGALKAFGNLILKTLGNLATSFGQQLIALGVAKMALDSMFAFPGGGVLAIAAGTALVAIGSALSASMSKSTGSLSPGAGGGSGSSPRPSYSGGSGDNGPLTLRFELEGEKLVAATDKYNYRRGRTR